MKCFPESPPNHGWLTTNEFPRLRFNGYFHLRPKCSRDNPWFGQPWLY
jgi:hypothetical protein